MCPCSALSVGLEVRKQIYYSTGLFNNPATQLLPVHWVSLSSPTAAQYVVTCVVDTVLIDLCCDQPQRGIWSHTHDSGLCSKWLLLATVADKSTMCWCLPAMKWEMLRVCLYGGWFFFFTKHSTGNIMIYGSWMCTVATGNQEWNFCVRPSAERLFGGWKGKCGACKAPPEEAQ